MGFFRFLHCTPIAWLQTTHQPTKMLVALAGVCFSNVLMFFQLGLMDSLYNSQRKPIELMQADFVMVSTKYVNLASLVTFPRSRLYQMLGVEGVEHVTPLRIGRSNWLNPDTRKTYDIYVYGVNPVFNSFNVPEFVKNQSLLQQLRTAIFDKHSKAQYGNVAEGIKQKGKFTTELDGHQIDVIDTFSMGATFAADANLITSDSTFLYLFPDHPRDQIEIGLIKCKPGFNPEVIKAAAKSLQAQDVQVFSKKEFSQVEMNYWKKNSSVGTIFTLGVFVGFIVGSIIVYQILFGDVSNSLAQYATLKAMGYTDRFVTSIVIQQSAILAILGFFPGIGLSFVLYHFLADATKLSIYMTTFNAVLVLVLTFVMCVGAGMIATKKVIELDPADVF